MNDAIRPYNFGAGPATLPLEILKKGQEALIDWQSEGMSIVEISHRSKAFLALMDELEARFRDLLSLPENYRILFMGVPSRMHFSLIAENFLKTKADYVVSGLWSKMAYEEARRFGNIQVAANGEEDNFLKLSSDWQLSPEADYLYFTPNETLTGLKITLPDEVSVPVVADMTSSILSEPLDLSRYGCLFAGAQKNIGPAGLSVLIFRDDFLKTRNPSLPLMNDYLFQVEKDSLYATPPSFSCYMALLMCRWLSEGDRLSEVQQANRDKAALLYDTIDNSAFYKASVDEPKARSIMNVAFDLENQDLTDSFLSAAKSAGLLALKGHRSVGGLRASIYNAMPLAGVKALVQFMKQFERQHS